MPTPQQQVQGLAGAWARALYGPQGFYRRPGGPAVHFATSAQGLPGVDELLAQIVAELAHAHGLNQVVEIGCGRGELLNLLAGGELQLLGVDIVERPETLAPGVDWLRSPGGDQLPEQLRQLSGALVFAHEWLDVVPCEIAVRTPQGHRALGVAADGSLHPDRPLRADEQAWQQAHWPGGELVEIGLSRDRAYHRLRSRITDGLLVCVDYGHLAADRPPAATFTGYRSGSICEPRFDGSTDLTAHVAMDSLGHGQLLRQHEIARRFGARPQRPEHRLARTDPAGYLQALRRRGAWASFTDPSGLGGFWWSIDRVTSSDAARR